MYYNNQWYWVAHSETRQNGAAFPREGIAVYAPVTAFYGIVIEKISTTSDHLLNVFSAYHNFYPGINDPSQSVITPCVGEKVLCVGATDLSDQIESFSSQGPTIPNENTGIVLDKPDFTAPDGVSTATYGTLNFYGTSPSAPHVGGAAALYLQMENMDPNEAENQMITNTVDLGATGYDYVYGHGRVRLKFRQLKRFNISLSKGWDLISFPLNLTNKSIKKIFKNINFSSIFSYSSWLYYFNETENNFDKINETNGYWINSLNNQTLTIEGMEFNLVNISLKQGYNLIGYPSLEENNISFIFNNINDSLINILNYENNEWKSYSPLKNEALNSLKTIKPGYGYLVNVNNNVSLNFD